MYGRVIVPLLIELGLDRIEEITIEDGRLLAGKDLTLEDDLPDVEPVAQKMGERAAGKRDSSHFAARLERSHLGDDLPLAEILRWIRQTESLISSVSSASCQANTC